MFIEVTTSNGKQLVNVNYIQKVFRDKDAVGKTKIAVGDSSLIGDRAGTMGSIDIIIQVDETYDEIRNMLVNLELFDAKYSVFRSDGR